MYDSQSGESGVLEILEFANSQLLEFRYYDHLLDVELARTYARLQRGGWRPPWIGRRYARTARQIHALFIDVNELTDKAENALKIAGDVYAARLFAMTAARLGLEQWKGNVREKLQDRWTTSTVLPSSTRRWREASSLKRSSSFSSCSSSSSWCIEFSRRRACRVQ